jgi:hypothetical protein
LAISKKEEALPAENTEAIEAGKKNRQKGLTLT